MARKPQVNIITSDGFTTGSIGKKLTAVKWQIGQVWYVVTADSEPQKYFTEQSATVAFLDALGVPRGA